MNLKQVGVGGGNIFQNYPDYVPDSVRFKPTKRALAARRVPVKFRSEQSSYATDKNRLIRFLLPNNALYDTRKGYLTFDLTITGSNGTYCRLHQGVFSILERLRVLMASAEVEDLRDYNRLYSFLWEMINPGLVTTMIGGTVMGFGTQTERNAMGATTTSYCCPLISGVLNTELLPFENLASGMTLELYLDDVTQFLETDSTTLPVVTVSNLMFHMERLELEQSYMNFIGSWVRSNGLQLGFQSWERFVNAMSGGFNQNLMINHRSSAVNGICHFFFDSSQFNNMTINDRFLNWTPLSLTSTSLNVNGVIFPDEPIDTVTAGRLEAYQIYCRWIVKWKLSGLLPIAPPIGWKDFQVNRFVLIDDLEPYPEESDLINPFSTLGNNSTLIKKLVFSSAIPANYQLDSWVEYFKQVGIYQDGSVRVLQ